MPDPTPREAQLLDEIARLQNEVELLRQKLDALARRVFGVKSEQLDPAQLQLLLAGLGEGPKAAASAAPGALASDLAEADSHGVHPSRAPRKPRIPEHLPVVEVVIDPEPVKACPQAWRCIGEEISEQLDYEPARFLRRRLIRRKYVRSEDRYEAPIIAPLPSSLQERCLAAPGLLAHVIVAKFCDHLPLYRQEAIYRIRHGVELPRQTLARWLELAADWLRPIYEHIRTGVLGGGYMQVDETPIRYLAPGRGATKLGYLWTFHRPGVGVFYDWQTSRAAACLEAIIPADFRGTMQSDGYAAYPAFARQRGGAITLAGCWAHARRKFHEALEQSPRVSGWILRQVAALYHIEARLRARRASPALRQAERASHSRMILARLHRAMRAQQRRHLPQSLIGVAITYALDQWSRLERFIEDGRIEIDNNLVENAIRPTAVGKKNWLFVGDADAGQRGAILYTLVENCRRLGLDPYAYLCDVLTRLPHATNWNVQDLAPAAWAKAQRHPPAVAAA